MIVNETGDWNILERTEKKSKGLLLVKNDKKGQTVIIREMTENDKSWHEKDQEYVLKLMWHPYVNYLTFEMLKNYKNMPDCHYEINDEKWQKMTENDRKWHNKWLKMRQVIET